MPSATSERHRPNSNAIAEVRTPSLKSERHRSSPNAIAYVRAPSLTSERHRLSSCAVARVRAAYAKSRGDPPSRETSAESGRHPLRPGAIRFAQTPSAISKRHPLPPNAVAYVRAPSATSDRDRLRSNGMAFVRTRFRKLGPFHSPGVGKRRTCVFPVRLSPLFWLGARARLRRCGLSRPGAVAAR